MSPAARSMAHLRDQGYRPVWLAEYWNHFSKRRVDFLGFIDIVALRPGEILGVQATTRDHISERVKKIQAHENFRPALEAGFLVKVQGWDKFKGRWRLHEVDCL